MISVRLSFAILSPLFTIKHHPTYLRSFTQTPRGKFIQMPPLRNYPSSGTSTSVRNAGRMEWKGGWVLSRSVFFVRLRPGFPYGLSDMSMMALLLMHTVILVSSPGFTRRT